MIRNEYKPIEKTFLSIKNEPIGFFYPDMYKAYRDFSLSFNISTDNFILTNGCENAIRIILTMLKVNETITDKEPLLIENPGWELVKVLSEAMKIPYKLYNYDINGLASFNKAKCIYTTDTYNNVIKHEFPKGESDLYIIDESYTMKHYFNNSIIPDNFIYIGSFSKLVSPELRLGYIIFPSKFKNEINLLREQYINQAAILFLSNLSIKDPDYSIPKIDKQNLILSAHPTYLTLDVRDFPLAHKKFTIDGKTICRIGRIDNKEQEVSLLNDLLRNIN